MKDYYCLMLRGKDGKALYHKHISNGTIAKLLDELVEKSIPVAMDFDLIVPEEIAKEFNKKITN